MPLPETRIDSILDHVDAHLGESLERLYALLRLKSISTDPAFAADCAATADWLAAELEGLGISAKAYKTEGHPIVMGTAAAEQGPTVLFYGHYDVQPVDPLDLWHSDPFDPQIVEAEDGTKRIVARGASDDKGQVMTFIEALRAFKAVNGSLPVGVKLMIEGEEESGGKSVPGFLEAHKQDLAADIALVCDTDMWDAKTPAITNMLRGLMADEIEISCADRDLHSGMYGNAARNPNQLLAEIIASLRAPDGSIAIDGFYDDVRELPGEVLEMWNSLAFDDKAYLGGVGLSVPAGEQDRSVLEQVTSRPTCEINGMSGGYTGDGFKTVIPAKASAKISFRLVADQDPDKVRSAFRAHVEALMPKDCTVTFTGHGGAPAISAPISGPFMTRARQALAAEWGREAVLKGTGGSIPIVADFKQKLGLDSLLIGFALDDDAIHSPNEKYDLESFHRGIRSWVRVLAAFV